MTTIEVSARIGAMIVRMAAARGVDAGALARAAGFDPAVAQDPDARIDLAVEEALWDEAARRTSDRHFGLHAAQLLRPGMFDVLDYAVRTAPTLRTALDRLVRYNRLVHSAAVFTVSERADRVRIEHAFAVAGRRPGRHPGEFTLASLLVIGRQLTGARLRALAVELPHAAEGDDLAPYLELFGVAPRFAAAVGAVELARTDVERACPAADPLLSEVILRQASALLAARPDASSSCASRVRAHVVERLGETSVTLASTARGLRLSARSLQRKLAAEGLTFDAVLDDLRRDLATRYLADPTKAIGEVAYLLGYSEPSAFHRAFKRWTGRTPADVRGRAA